MSAFNRLAKSAIVVLQNYSKRYSYLPRVHFELEVGYSPDVPCHRLNFNAIYSILKQQNIPYVLAVKCWLNLYWRITNHKNGLRFNHINDKNCIFIQTLST